MTGTPAVVLLSGGLDSATTTAVARRDGHDVHALSFDYGQRHDYELHAAQVVAEHLDVADYRVIRVDLAGFGGSALTDHTIPVPTVSAPGIPVTYVPARNTIFLSYALAYAEIVGAVDIYLGVNAVDYSGYPDCRPEYIAAFEAMANLATRAGVEGQRLTIHAPLIDMTKPDIIRLGLSLGVNYGMTWSCYNPQPSWDFSDLTPDPCRRCDSCRIRAAAFAEVGTIDPVAV